MSRSVNEIERELEQARARVLELEAEYDRAHLRAKIRFTSIHPWPRTAGSTERVEIDAVLEEGRFHRDLYERMILSDDVPYAWRDGRVELENFCFSSDRDDLLHKGLDPSIRLPKKMNLAIGESAEGYVAGRYFKIEILPPTAEGDQAAA